MTKPHCSGSPTIYCNGQNMSVRSRTPILFLGDPVFVQVNPAASRIEHPWLPPIHGATEGRYAVLVDGDESDAEYS